MMLVGQRTVQLVKVWKILLFYVKLARTYSRKESLLIITQKEQHGRFKNIAHMFCVCVFSVSYSMPLCNMNNKDH